MSDFLLELVARTRSARKLITDARACRSRCPRRSSARGPVGRAAAGRSHASSSAPRRAALGADAGGDARARRARTRASSATRDARAVHAPARRSGARAQSRSMRRRDKPYRALVFDATGIADAERAARALRLLPPARRRASTRSGRVVVLGRAPETRRAGGGGGAARRSTASSAVCAKEVGAQGRDREPGLVEHGAEGARCRPVLRFLLVAALGVRHRAAAPRQRASGAGASSDGEARDAAARGQGRARHRRGARHRRRPRRSCSRAEGAHVVCLDRPDDDAPLSAGRARRSAARSLLADVDRRRGAGDASPSALQERLGGVDVVVHNAGITRDKTLARMTPELWDQTLDVNLAAVARITRRCSRARAARRRAHRLPVVGRGHRRQRRPDQLRGVEGRHHRLRARARAAARGARHHRQRDRARASSRRA